MGNTTHDDLEQRALALMPTVRRLARALARRLPPHLSIDDLVGAGNLGLVQAVRRYQPQEGATFEAYALGRARGAMLDELRALDPLTRYERRKLSTVRKTTENLRAQLQREPSMEEVTAACGIAPDARDRLAAAASARLPVSLQSGFGTDDERPMEPPGETPDAETLTLARHEKERLAFAVGRLPERMQSVLQMSFEHGKKLQEVADEFGVSQARAHQLREAAVERVARAYKAVSIVPADRAARRRRTRSNEKARGGYDEAC